ncbi:hypothetical protein L1049_026828 [Liquidambar formosana]|uniref:PRA1 family protein n=1 Tax=Liquidambar formosana TaxID=63359 RepID=A0AAP0NEF1_LIQFO
MRRVECAPEIQRRHAWEYTLPKRDAEIEDNVKVKWLLKVELIIAHVEWQASKFVDVLDSLSKDLNFDLASIKDLNASASSFPPILPISNPTTTTTSSASAAQSQQPVATPAVRVFFTHICETVRNGLSQHRPWSELVDRSAFSRLEFFSEVALRVHKNYSYFRVNYLSLLALVLVLVLGVSLLTNPFSLFLLLGLLVAWLFLYLFRPSNPPLIVFSRTFTERETLGILVVLSVVVIFLTSVGSVLISALLAGLAIVCVHGWLRVPEDLFLDEQEPAATGFLSFLGGAASNAAAPAVATRV